MLYVPVRLTLVFLEKEDSVQPVDSNPPFSSIVSAATPITALWEILFFRLSVSLEAV